MNKLLKSIALIAFVVPALLISAEDDDHVPVGRPKYADFLAADEKEDIYILPVQQEEEHTVCGFIFDRYPPIYYPSSYHLLRSVSAIGDSLELEDGSVWRLPLPEGTKTLYWRADVPIAITQNTSWFSRYKYRLIYNPESDYPVSIETNLHLGPYKDGEHTLYAADLNHYGRSMVLSDFSQWEIYSWDDSKFRNWQPNDVIIIGFNSDNGWLFSSSYDALLINVSADEFVRARQY